MFIGFDKIFRATLYLRWIPCYLRMAVFEPRDFSRCHLTTRKTPWTGSWFDRGFALFCLRSLKWRKIRFAWEFSIASLKYIEKECRYERALLWAGIEHVMCCFKCQIVKRRVYEGMVNVTCPCVWYIFK